ncbi:MAG: 3-oxoacyl-ACP reductase FabG [Clostridia bacterium]|nr:3-oxoacyl-ACP reductase FabG [Clostridia bacterium]
MRLDGKVAIVTGGASGIGKETCRVFAAEGAKVVIADYNEAAGRAFEAELTAAGHAALFLQVDVSSSEQVKKTVATVVEKFGRIDILINNAGITADASLMKMTEEQWDRVISINLKGVFNFTQAVAAVMAPAGKGKIVSASSVVGIQGNFGQTNYVAAKAGVIGMTKVWARELGRKGIRVNAVAPGFILTDMTAKMPETVLDGMKSKTPVGRLGLPKDIANAYLFLASDESDFVNGAVLSVDGGVTI